MIASTTPGTRNLANATRFYDAVMPPSASRPPHRFGCRNFRCARRTASDVEIGVDAPEDSRCHLWIVTPINGQPTSIGNGTMPALVAQTRSSGDSLYAAGLANGGTDEGTPGPCPYGPGFYACYLRDPDGNKRSAACETAEP